MSGGDETDHMEIVIDDNDESIASASTQNNEVGTQLYQVDEQLAEIRAESLVQAVLALQPNPNNAEQYIETIMINNQLVNEDETNQHVADGDVEEEEEPESRVSPVREAPEAANISSDDDGQICTICFEQWTSSGEHRLVSLRCGHLFGRNCISKWLRGQGSRCPQCNARARKSEIRPIYARTVRVLDTSERDRALYDLEKETDKRRQCEMECANLRMKLGLLSQENEILRKQLMETQMLLNESRYVKSSEKLNNPSCSLKSSFKLVKNVEIRGGGCRIMDGSDLLGMLLVTQPSTNVLFPGHGLKKVSVPDMRTQEFVCLHQKPIKDVSFHPQDCLVLTASLDRTVKLTNCMSNSVVQTYNLNGDVWSCQWDLDDPCYFFAGVHNGTVYVYDIRVTDKHVYELQGLGQRSPVVSLSYLKQNPSVGRRTCGPIVGQLASCGFYEKGSAASYTFHPLPLEGRVMSLCCDSSTCHLLASFRPSQKFPKVTHTLCEMCFDNNMATCNLIYAMTGGSAHAQLTRSKLLPHPDNESSSIVCSGDEEAKAALIWDASTGSLIDSLKADAPVTDLMSFRDQHKSVLCTLSDKNLRVYSWTSS